MRFRIWVLTMGAGTNTFEASGAGSNAFDAALLGQIRDAMRHAPGSTTIVYLVDTTSNTITRLFP